jgi:hypothetical protein
MYITSIVRIPYDIPNSKKSYIEISPVSSVNGYGLSISNNIVLTSGHHEEKQERIQKTFEVYIFQSDLIDNENIEIYSECMENFYFNSLNQEGAITIFSMFMVDYFPDIVEALELKLPEKFMYNKKKSRSLGYNK